MITPSVQFITVSDENAQQRIDNFLIYYLKGVPKSLIYRILRKGEIRVNKKRVKPEYKLIPGDEIRIPPVRVAAQSQVALSPKLQQVKAIADAIIFEDDVLIIINKPSGIAVHGGSGLSFGLIEGLRALRPEARFLELVHRLDRATSGIILVAKKRSALRALHEQLQKKQMKKNYLALVRGHWQTNCQSIDAPLQKNTLQSGERVVKVNDQGKPSTTLFKIEENFTFATLIAAMPVTGRTHQIRVHTLYAGYPIAFDEKYGDHIFDEQLQFTGLNRLFLHARTLTFTHPQSGEIMQISAPLDKNLHDALIKLRAHRDNLHR